MIEEESFIKAILAARPRDFAPRLVFADWLEERGDPRGKCLRVQCGLEVTLPCDTRKMTLWRRLQQLDETIGPMATALHRRLKLARIKKKLEQVVASR